MLDIFSQVTYLSAFIAGIITILLPCTLPVFLGYIGVVTGCNKTGNSKKNILFHTIYFSFGFVVLYSLLGAVAGWFGQFSTTTLTIRGPVLEILRYTGGTILILSGLYLLKIFPVSKFFKNIHFITIPKWAKNNYVGSFVIGIAVAIGWSPCVSPILGSLLVYAANGATVWFGFSLLLTYTLGIVLPLIFCSYVYGVAFTQSKTIQKISKYLSLLGGLILVLLGLVFIGGYTGLLSVLTVNSSLYNLF